MWKFYITSLNNCKECDYQYIINCGILKCVPLVFQIYPVESKFKSTIIHLKNKKAFFNIENNLYIISVPSICPNIDHNKSQMRFEDMNSNGALTTTCWLWNLSSYFILVKLNVLIYKMIILILLCRSREDQMSCKISSTLCYSINAYFPWYIQGFPPKWLHTLNDYSQCLLTESPFSKFNELSVVKLCIHFLERHYIFILFFKLNIISDLVTFYLLLLSWLCISGVFFYLTLEEFTLDLTSLCPLFIRVGIRLCWCWS